MAFLMKTVVLFKNGNKRCFRKFIIIILNQKETAEELFKILSIADLDQSKSISYDEFKKMICNPEYNLDKNKVSLLVKVLRNITNTVAAGSLNTYNKIAKHTLREMVCTFPPPIFVITMTLVQISVYFYYDQMAKSNDETITSFFIKSPFIFDPTKRFQIWRYFTYSLLHLDLRHLACNMIMQFVIGVPLELNHRYKIVFVYLLGCLSGSLSAYLIDRSRVLLGSSAGVFALVFAFVTYCLFHFCEMKIKLTVFAAFMLIYIVLEIINIKFMSQQLQRSYLVHFSGILTGFLLGPLFFINDFHTIGNFLNNFKSLGVLIYILAISVLIYFNI